VNFREQMHVAAVTTTQSVLTSEELAKHRHNGNTTRYQRRRAAVGQGETIAVTEEGDDPGRHRFFSGAEVHFPGYEPAVPQILDRELVAASTQHFAVKTNKFHCCDVEEHTTDLPPTHPILDARCWMLDAGCWMLDASK